MGVGGCSRGGIVLVLVPRRLSSFLQSASEYNLILDIFAYQLLLCDGGLRPPSLHLDQSGLHCLVSTDADIYIPGPFNSNVKT